MNRRSLAMLAVGVMGCAQATAKPGTPTPQQSAGGTPRPATTAVAQGGPAGAPQAVVDVRPQESRVEHDVELVPVVRLDGDGGVRYDGRHG